MPPTRQASGRQVRERLGGLERGRGAANGTRRRRAPVRSYEQAYTQVQMEAQLKIEEKCGTRRRCSRYGNSLADAAGGGRQAGESRVDAADDEETLRVREGAGRACV